MQYQVNPPNTSVPPWYAVDLPSDPKLRVRKTTSKIMPNSPPTRTHQTLAHKICKTKRRGWENANPNGIFQLFMLERGEGGRGKWGERVTNSISSAYN